VSVLILILINVSTPLFRSTFHRIRLETTCRELSQTMRYLQTRSSVEGVRYRLLFNFQDGAYWGESEKRAAYGDQGFEPLEERIGGRHTIRNGIVAEGNVSNITFYPDGRVDNAELLLKDLSGLAYALTVRDSDIRIEEIVEGSS
jgi:hypothetical protein